MVSDFIKQFKQLSSQIELAAIADDLELVRDLDKSLIQIWENLLRCETANADETIELAAFLIDRLFDVGPISEHHLQIKRKLLALYENRD